MNNFDWSRYKSDYTHVSDKDFIRAIPVMKVNRRIKNGIMVRNGKVITKYIDINNPIWKVIDKILGKFPDENIAGFFALPVYIIRNRRECYHIPPFGYIDNDTLESLLSNGSDREVANLLSTGYVSRRSVAHTRKILTEPDVFSFKDF